MAEVELSSSLASIFTFSFFFALVNAMGKPNLYLPAISARLKSCARP
jgi:hypothetical protein